MAAADGFDEIADRLYALPPGDFTAARDDQAKAARSAGDRAGAAAIAKLRRPTVAAWIVNLLALRRPKSIDELLELGAALSRAQQELRGPELRDLTTKRRALVGTMVRQAADLAAAAGANATLPLVEVETTLTAALSDAQLADVVRAGRLLKSGAYDGFGEAPRPHLQAVPDDDVLDDDAVPTARNTAPKPAGKSAAKSAAGKSATTPAIEAAAENPAARESAPRPVARASTVDAAGLRQRLDDATAALADAEATHAAAVAAVDDRTREVAEVEEHLAQLRRDRLAAHAAVLAAHAASDAADAALQAAQRRHAAAVRAAKRLM